MIIEKNCNVVILFKGEEYNLRLLIFLNSKEEFFESTAFMIKFIK
jgi:hypothetical protein